MFEGLFQPMHLLVLLMLLVGGIGFVVLRLLWKADTRLGK